MNINGIAYSRVETDVRITNFSIYETNNAISSYEEFSKNLATKDNIEFLKDYYGIGGSSYTIKGSGIGESHDSKGITFNRGYLDSTTRKQLFTWSQIVKRIKELIKLK